MTKIKLPFIKRYRDRHGRMRHYFRREGRPSVRLPGPPGGADFMRVYEAALAGDPVLRQNKNGPGSVGQLVTDYYASVEFANLKPNSKRIYRTVLDRLVLKHGHRLVREMPRVKIKKIIAEIGADRPGMANLSIAVIVRLLSFAVDSGVRDENPALRLKRFKIGTHHTWTDDELAGFEKRWPLGTRERLAYALLLYTGQRVGDVARMRREHISAGAIHLEQEKTGKELVIPIHAVLARAIAATPVVGMQHLICDPHGRPVKGRAVTHLIREAVAAAGLSPRCKAHGLRKATLRRLAELGKSTHELAAI